MPTHSILIDSARRPQGSPTWDFEIEITPFTVHPCSRPHMRLTCVMIPSATCSVKNMVIQTRNRMSRNHVKPEHIADFDRHIAIAIDQIQTLADPKTWDFKNPLLTFIAHSSDRTFNVPSLELRNVGIPPIEDSFTFGPKLHVVFNEKYDVEWSAVLEVDDNIPNDSRTASDDQKSE